jgi:hypothetical protein
MEENGAWVCDFGDSDMGGSEMAMMSMEKKGMWGNCTFSSGVWGQCKASKTGLDECMLGKKEMAKATEKYCDWGNNVYTKCYSALYGWVCDNATMNSTGAMQPSGNWSQCHMNNGTWGWCTMGNGEPKCLWGMKQGGLIIR